jgi:Fe-S cluster assembly protein SufD
MQIANNRQLLAPGVSCDHALHITTRATDDGFHFSIHPESDSMTTVYVVLSESNAKKNYTFEVDFHEPNAAVSILGLYQLRENKAIEIKTRMNHHVPHCTSHQLWKGVLDDSAKVSFEGKIHVAPQAQKTNAQLSNKNLLLSSGAEVNTKPILEIYADDVKCSHGATVGCLDENAIFYLRSRGIPEDAARALLIESFANEILDAVAVNHVI